MSDQVTEPRKMTNEDRRAEKLRGVVDRASTWRQRVWAEQQRRIDAANAEMESMGFPPHSFVSKPPTTPDELEHASQLKIKK